MLRIYADGVLLHHSELGDPVCGVFDKKMSAELNRAGSFQFTIFPTHPLYNEITRFKTKIEVYRDDELLFYGRVFETTIGSDLKKEVICEGSLSYLNDSQQEPYTSNPDITVEAFFRRCIENHNAQVEADKQFTVGTVNVAVKDKVIHIEETSYDNTRSVIDDVLISVYHGYIRARRQNGVNYIDYIENYTEVSNQTIEFGFNLKDIKKKTPSVDLFTVLLPIGEDNLKIGSVNNNSPYLENADLIAKYGRIVHVENFNGIDNAASLLTEAQRFFAANAEASTMPVFEVRAVDLHNFAETFNAITVGVKYPVITPEYDRVLVQASSVEYDFDHIKETVIEFTEPDVTYKGSAYGSRSSSSGSASSKAATSSTKAAKAEAATQRNLKYYHELEGTANIIANDIGLESSNTHISVHDKLSLIATEADFQKFKQEGGVGSIVEITPSGFSSITGVIEAVMGAFKGAEGTGIIQNMESITQFAGKFQVMNDGSVQLMDGAAFKVQKNGVFSTVGTVTEIQAVDDDVRGVKTRVTTIEGTGVYQNSEHITQVAGKFTVDNQNNVHIVDGSGLKIDKSGTSYGVYSEDNLDDGVIINKIVNGTHVQEQASFGTYINNKLDAGVMVTKITGISGSQSTTVKMGTYINNQLDAGTMVQKITSGDGTNQYYVNFGTYINGRLDAGIIVNKLNDDTTNAKILAKRIDIDGVVTSLTSREITALRLNVTNNVNAGSLWLRHNTGTEENPSSTFTSITDHYHQISVGNDGKITLGALTWTQPAPFDIKDTKPYKDGIRDAKNNVQMSNTGGWMNGSFIVDTDSPTPRHYTVSLPAFNTSQDANWNSSHKKNVYFSTQSVNAALATAVVDASGLWQTAYTEGANSVSAPTVGYVTVAPNTSESPYINNNHVIQGAYATVYFSDSTYHAYEVYGGVDMTDAYNFGWTESRNNPTIGSAMHLTSDNSSNMNFKIKINGTVYEITSTAVGQTPYNNFT